MGATTQKKSKYSKFICMFFTRKGHNGVSERQQEVSGCSVVAEFNLVADQFVYFYDKAL